MCLRVWCSCVWGFFVILGGGESLLLRTVWWRQQQQPPPGSRGGVSRVGATVRGVGLPLFFPCRRVPCGGRPAQGKAGGALPGETCLAEPFTAPDALSAAKALAEKLGISLGCSPTLWPAACLPACLPRCCSLRLGIPRAAPATFSGLLRALFAVSSLGQRLPPRVSCRLIFFPIK